MKTITIDLDLISKWYAVHYDEIAALPEADSYFQQLVRAKGQDAIGKLDAAYSFLEGPLAGDLFLLSYRQERSDASRNRETVEAKTSGKFGITNDGLPPSKEAQERAKQDVEEAIKKLRDAQTTHPS